MKRALIGLSDNISENINKIKLWAKTFRRYCNDDIILLTVNSSITDIQMCENLNLGIICKSVYINNVKQINHKRLEHISNFLHISNIDLCIITDVFDVVFQANPFIKLDITKYDVFVGGEGILVNQEPWNNHNIGVLFEHRIEKCRNNEVICSGVIAGKKQTLIAVYNKMFELCENSPDNHDIKDQAALIVMIANNMIPNIKIFNLDDGWVVHCAVAGPTVFFDSWGFRNNLKYGIPQMKDDGRVYTQSGDLFDIVHQFNRVPEWHQKIRETI